MLKLTCQASVPRDVLPPTPPGPEGSNGNGLLRVQWVPGAWLFIFVPSSEGCVLFESGRVLIQRGRWHPSALPGQARSALGLARQIVFVSMGGFDTPSDQLTQQ